jgi:hypothetical protein
MRNDCVVCGQADCRPNPTVGEALLQATRMVVAPELGLLLLHAAVCGAAQRAMAPVFQAVTENR